MPSFKPKTNKKIKLSKRNATTLDGTHKEIVNEFMRDEYDNIPKLKEEKQYLLEELETNKQLTIDEKMEIKDRINEIVIIVKNLKEKKLNYYLDNSKYIFDYFENKKNIATNVSEQSNIVNNKTKLVNDFFKIKSVEPKDDKKDDITKNIVQKYLSNIDDSFIDINNFLFCSDICPTCGQGELIPLEDEGLLICNECSTNVPYLIENEKPSYKEPPKEVCFYAYKKINHFKEILAQFQGKETTQIPDDVIEKIKKQIQKERVSLHELDYIKTKEILKKLEFNKYYEHIAFIKNKLGISPPIMTPELEETLCNLFMELQAPYAKNCPDYRVNFLNYYYVLYKLCELLGEDSYLQHIPMLKDREKLIDQDETWRKMCDELDWDFIPTV
jgi:Poxvirus Late Transcription Factor VLTF3 like